MRTPPTPTPVPPRPTATAPPPAAGIIEVGCSIIPNRTIQVGEVITLTATQNPATIPVRYAFEHGDGTLDPNPVSSAYYTSPGNYAVTLRWELNGTRGAIPCGTVNVVAAPAAAPQVPSNADFLGLSETGAVQLAAERGFSFVRVARRDSLVYPPVAGGRADRLNIEVDGGRVTSAVVG